MVNAVTSLALEPKGNVVKAGSTSQNTGRSAVAVCLLIQRLEQTDALPCRDIEGLFDNYDLHPGRVLENTLPEYESITGHPAANNQMVRLVGSVLIDGTTSGYGVDSQQNSD